MPELNCLSRISIAVNVTLYALVASLVLWAAYFLAQDTVEYRKRHRERAQKYYSYFYDSGQKAAKLKIPASANPYTDSYQRVAWYNGYISVVNKGEDKRKETNHEL